MNCEIEITETPGWLQELEAKREKRLRRKLGHELGAGAPCIDCGDKCPGLDLHFWRKICKNCKCSKENHEVEDDDIYGWAQDELLGRKPNKLRKKIVLPGKKEEVELDWAPKGQNETVDKYLKTLPPDLLPIKGSQAAQDRKQLLKKQMPIHDIDPTLCHDLTDEELKQMNEYIAHIKQNSVGVGLLIQVGSKRGHLHFLGDANARVVSSNTVGGKSTIENVTLQDEYTAMLLNKFNNRFNNLKLNDSLRHGHDALVDYDMDQVLKDSDVGSDFVRQQVLLKNNPNHPKNVVSDIQNPSVVGEIKNLHYGVGMPANTETIQNNYTSWNVPTDRGIIEDNRLGYSSDKQNAIEGKQDYQARKANIEHLMQNIRNLEENRKSPDFVPIRSSVSNRENNPATFRPIRDINYDQYSLNKSEHPIGSGLIQEPRFDRHNIGNNKNLTNFAASNLNEISSFENNPATFKPIRDIHYDHLNLNYPENAMYNEPGFEGLSKDNRQLPSFLANQHKFDDFENDLATFKPIRNHDNPNDSRYAPYLSDGQHENSNGNGNDWQNIGNFDNNPATFKPITGLSNDPFTPNNSGNSVGLRESYQPQLGGYGNKENEHLPIFTANRSAIGSSENNPVVLRPIRDVNYDQLNSNNSGNTVGGNRIGDIGQLSNYPQNRQTIGNYENNATAFKPILDINYDGLSHKNSDNAAGFKETGHDDYCYDDEGKVCKLSGTGNFRNNPSTYKRDSKLNCDPNTATQHSLNNPSGEYLEGLEELGNIPNPPLPNYIPGQYNRFQHEQQPKGIRNIRDLAYSTYNDNSPPANNNLESYGDSKQSATTSPNPNRSTNPKGETKHLPSLPTYNPDDYKVPEDYLQPTPIRVGPIKDIDHDRSVVKCAIQKENDFFEGSIPQRIETAWDENNLPSCHSCKKMFKQDEIAIAIPERSDSIFHTECFKCHGCNQILADMMYFYDKDSDEIYCGRDYAKIRGIPRCRACDELIFVKEYCLAENSTFHVKHFCCFECDTPLAGQNYVVENDQPLCLPCYENTKANKCFSCMKIIHPDEQGLQLKDGVHYHATETCFACKMCNLPLFGAKLLFRNDQLYCSHDCFNRD